MNSQLRFRVRALRLVDGTEAGRLLPGAEADLGAEDAAALIRAGAARLVHVDELQRLMNILAPKPAALHAGMR